MAGNFTLEGRAKGLLDPIRKFNWELSLPEISKVIPTASEDGLNIRTRSAAIGGSDFEVLERQWMGVKEFFPGKRTFSSTFGATFEETEDLYVVKTLHAWQEKIFSWNPDGPNPGSSSFEGKRKGMVIDGFLKMYKFGRNNQTDKMVRFRNLWPKTIGDVALDYGNNEILLFDVTFQYDYVDFIDVK